MFAPRGYFLCKICKSKLYDAQHLQVIGDTFTFHEACKEDMTIFCGSCDTVIGFTKKDVHYVNACCLIYFS